MQKLITVVNANPRLKPHFEKLISQAKQGCEQVDFLTQRIKTIRDNCALQSHETWAQIEQELKAQGLLPEGFDGEKIHLHYNDETDVLVSCDADHNQQLPAFLAQIMGKA
jgi:hypothetical protein